MLNTYADIDTPLSDLLHGAARMHVSLGRMDSSGISTRGWSYNDLVDGALSLNAACDPATRQSAAIDTLFDTLDALVEIGPNAVAHLNQWGV